MRHYQRGLMIIFILGSITPDIFWLVYASDYFGIFPPVPPYIIPFVQFLHGILGQLFLWSWVAFALAATRTITYENAISAGVAGAILHHIVDLSSHAEGQYPLYPYVQQDWSVGWFLENTSGLFNELTWFGLLLFVMFIIMFGLVLLSYTRIRLLEHLRLFDVFFINLILTVVLLSYWIGFALTFILLIVICISWLVVRLYLV
jgi:hypothetical protein